MGNIPTVNQPNAPQGVGLGQENINLGTEPARALQGLGQAMTVTSETFDAFHDKKQKLYNDQAAVQLKNTIFETNMKIDSFAKAHQHKPDLIPKYAQEQYGKVMDRVDTSLVDDEAAARLRMEFEHQNARSQIVASSEVERIRIENANATFLQNAEFEIENGNIDAAIQSLNAASLPDGQKQQWLQVKLQGNIYNQVGLELDAMATPEELEAFAEDILTKGDRGIYEEYVSELNIKDDELIKIAGLKENQRAHFARLAKSRSNAIKGEQNRNWSSYLKRAAKGDTDVAIEIETALLRPDAGGIPAEFRETAMKQVNDAINGYESEQQMKVLVAEAKKEDDYKEFVNQQAAYYFNDEDFDLEDSLSTIDGLPVADQVKVELRANAFAQASAKYEKMKPQAGRQMPKLSIFHMAYGAMFDKPELTQNEIDTLNYVSQEFKDLNKAAGSAWTTLNDDVEDIQKKVNQFWSKNPNATPKEAQEFQDKLFEPLEEAWVRYQMKGVWEVKEPAK